jgi:putative tricarboxylic transport membrane protein
MADRVIFVCTLVVAAIYFYATSLIPSLEIGDPLGPKAFPRLLGVCLLLAAALLFIEMWKDRKAVGPPQPFATGPDRRHLWILGAVCVWTLAYYLVFEKAGYILATSVYLLALMAWFNRGRWIANGASALLFSIFSYVLFLKLDVRLPPGILAF